MTDREPSRFSDTRKVGNITLPRAAEQARKALELALESQFAPDDAECEHGMHYRDCPNDVCMMRDCKAALAALDAALAEPEPTVKDSLTVDHIWPIWGASENEVEAMMPRPAPSLEFLDGFRDGFRAAERFHGVRKEDGK
jgi:hypothetical protein